ncbi:MAG: M20/M25/M40 family metallo-hydrolase, partial [bacterium]
MTVLHGRGVVDDKGPLASLMGVMDRFAGEEPENLPGTLCFIIDTAEEVGFGTAREYLDQHPDRIPDRSLVSDGYFPLVAGEKGLLWFDVEITPTECSDEGGRSPTLVELRAGSAYNQVPDSAHARLRIGEENHRRVREAFRRNHPSLTDRLREDYRDDGLLILEAEGESAHGAQPEDGKNALEVLLTYLGKIDWEHQNVELLFEKLQTMLDEQGTYRYDGSWIDLDDTDPRYDTGTTLNLGKMQYDSETGKITLSFDARLMPDQEIDVTLTKLRGILMDWLPDPWETSVKPVNREEALSINMENVLPTTALEAYRAVKEEPEAQPVYMGGRTHATAIPNCFAFGLMQFEHAHSYNFHGPHERVAWSELVEGAQIYYQTIRRLNGT